jgi:hypothetical protein
MPEVLIPSEQGMAAFEGVRGDDYIGERQRRSPLIEVGHQAAR